MVNIYENVDRNKQKSLLVMTLFIAFVVSVTWVFAKAMGYGLDMVGLAFIFAGLGSLLSYYYSYKIILGLSGAREANRTRDFNFYTVAENLSMAAHMPMPKLYVIDDTAMNAFATGRDPQHAALAA